MFWVLRNTNGSIYLFKQVALQILIRGTLGAGIKNVKLAGNDQRQVGK